MLDSLGWAGGKRAQQLDMRELLLRKFLTMPGCGENKVNRCMSQSRDSTIVELGPKNYAIRIYIYTHMIVSVLISILAL